MSDLRILALVRRGRFAVSGYVLAPYRGRMVAVHQSEYMPALLRLVAKARGKS